MRHISDYVIVYDMKSFFGFALLFIFFLSSSMGCASTEKNERSCNQEEIVMSEPAAAENSSSPFQAKVRFFGERKKPAARSILIMPPTGGTNYIDRRYAQELCNNNYDVYILNEWSEMSSRTIELTLHQNYYARAQRAISLVFSEISSEFIGMLGTSLGGLHTSVSLQTQPRLDAAFIITAGLPIIDVIMTSDQDAMIRLRKIRMQEFKFPNESELQKAIENVFHLEPTRLGEHFKNKKIGVALALNDRTVPTKSQQRLVDFFKPDTVLEYSSNHFWGIVKTWLFDSSEVVRFFNSASKTQASP